ncbi:hypothetical protein GCM10007860_25850 [Chitiniphilus shinanonensis]|uniref:Uncharacterized protein n=1 Tax=Chitiniphilus shinanonensis TaxID=553088 RepID=A0ABQ6BVN5_9NEIS|nr:hypothetical protein GCM10007860_25850 [Chitiniphilus shinanonensis]
MTNPYAPYPLRQHFPAGTRVVVSGVGAGWRNNPVGTVCGDPEPVQTVRGEDYYYWVRFDTPQHALSDDGPYCLAQVLSCCITGQARADSP